MTLRLVDEAQLRSLLPIEDAIDAVQAMFASEHPPVVPRRSHVDIDGGTLLMMPAASAAGVGVKLVTVAPDNRGRDLPVVQGVYVLFDPDSLAPAALIEGAALTALRTSAVSALATRCLARQDSERLVIFGAGVQAAAHLEAMRAVRPISDVTIVSRTRERAEKLAAEAREAGLAADVGDASAVADADIVCTCTTSKTPLFDGSILARGAHVNATGAFEPTAREIDEYTVKCGWIVVESRDVALAEAGDLLIPIGADVISSSDISADLSELARGAQVRMSDDDVTVFKSVGLASEDLAVAAAVAERLGVL